MLLRSSSTPSANRISNTYISSPMHCREATGDVIVVRKSDVLVIRDRGSGKDVFVIDAVRGPRSCSSTGERPCSCHVTRDRVRQTAGRLPCSRSWRNLHVLIILKTSK